jgi:hypothetical protein
VGFIREMRRDDAFDQSGDAKHRIAASPMYSSE